MRHITLMTHVCLLFFAAGSHAEDHNVPGEHGTIQGAIDHCDTGDTVLVAPGTYTGEGNRDIDFTGKAITVRSIDPNDPCIVAATILDCRGSPSEPHRGFKFHSGESASSVVAGLTIINGFGPESRSNVTDGIFVGGAICCLDGSNPTIVKCVLKNNLADAGGGIYLWDSAPVIRECVCIVNTAGDGGAICGRPVGRLLIADCAFEGNSATHHGGALHIVHADLALDRCALTGNSAAGRGGGVYVILGEMESQGCTFKANVAGQAGGALYYEHTELSMTRCAFVGNSAKGEAGRGGATGNYASNTTLDSCVFVGNAATVAGGGIWDQNGSSPSSAWLPMPTRLHSMNCTFVNNRATRGGTLASLSGEATLLTHVTIKNCIVWSSGGIWNGGGSTVEVDYSSIRNGWPGTGNIDADPCFAAPGHWDPNGTADDPNDDFWVEGDYHLKSQAGRWDPNSQSWVIDDVTSPCIDAGDPNSPIGYEPFPNGGRINMGAYGGTAEASKSYFGEPVCETIIAGDINGDCVVDFKDLAILTRHWLKDRSRE